MANMNFELTKEEKNAINTFKRLAKKWPDTLWLFSGSSTLWVMRYGPDGKPVMTPDGGFDPDYCVVKIDIENDGGDW